MGLSDKLITIFLVAAMTTLNILLVFSRLITVHFLTLRVIVYIFLLICYSVMFFKQWKRSKHTTEDRKFLAITYLTYFVLTITLWAHYRFSLPAFIVLFLWYLYAVDSMCEVEEFVPTEPTPYNQQVPDNTFSTSITIEPNQETRVFQTEYFL
jgi:hypothetical protein